MFVPRWILCVQVSSARIPVVRSVSLSGSSPNPSPAGWAWSVLQVSPLHPPFRNTPRYFACSSGLESMSLGPIPTPPSLVLLHHLSFGLSSSSSSSFASCRVVWSQILRTFQLHFATRLVNLIFVETAALGSVRIRNRPPHRRLLSIGIASLRSCLVAGRDRVMGSVLSAFLLSSAV